MFFTKTVRHFAVLIVSCNFCGVLCAQTQKEIRDKWEEKERIVESFSITWSEAHHRPEGKVLVEEGELETPKISTALDYSLSLQGIRYRYGVNGKLPRLQEGETVLSYRDTVSVFDGRRGKGLSSSESRVNQMGQIFETEERPGIMNNMSVQPVMFCFRMLNPKMSPIDTSKPFEIENTTVNGKSRVNVTFVDKDQRVERQLVLAPELDMSVVTYRLKVHGRAKTQFDLSYKRDSQANFWVPSGWTITRLANDGSIKSTIVGTVEECEVNPGLPDSEFELDFPVGTVINDMVENKTYVFRDDGSKRKVVREELIDQVPAKQLMETEPFDPLADGRRSRWNWLFFANAILLVLLLVAAVKKIRNRRG